jgi:catalase
MEVPEPLPKATKKSLKPEVKVSPALSLFALPGEIGIRTRRIAIIVADGIDVAGARALHEGLTAEGAVPRYIGPRLGSVLSADGDSLEVEVTLEAMPSVLFDAVAVPDGKAGIELLSKVGHAAEFLKDQYRHAKPMLALGAAGILLESAGIFSTLKNGEPDPGVLVRDTDAREALPELVAAIARHRHHERELDPPPV